MNTEIIDAGRDMSGGYKVDVSRGTNVDRVSSEWFSRPDDERYLSLDDLFASVKGRAERSRTRTVESAAIRVEAHRDNPEKLGLVLPAGDEPIAPTHWSFGQLSSLVGAPAAYLRQLPAPLAGINLQYGLTNHRAEQIKTMEVADGRTELRAVTGPDYANIPMAAPEAQLLADARSRWENTVGGLQDALRVQAGVVGNIDGQRAELSALVGESQSAVGALQATQAGNQLLALQSQQIADLIAVVAANGRASALVEAERSAAAEQGRVQRERFLTPGAGYQPGNARMFNN